MQFIDKIPYITMILSITAIIIQYISFIKSKNMDNIPYSGLMGMLIIGILNYFYKKRKASIFRYKTREKKISFAHL